MAKKNPELSAFQQIVTALQALEPHLQDRVLASVLAFLGKPLPPPDDPMDRTDVGPKEREQSPPTRPKGLTELLAEKNPGTNGQKIALFAYYRDKFENNPRFSRADLKAYFAKARLEPPGNYDRDFSSAVEKGWLHENDDQSYITTSGIEAVEQSFDGERTYSKARSKKKVASKTSKGRKAKARR